MHLLTELFHFKFCCWKLSLGSCALPILLKFYNVSAAYRKPSNEKFLVDFFFSSKIQTPPQDILIVNIKLQILANTEN